MSPTEEKIAAELLAHETQWPATPHEAAELIAEDYPVRTLADGKLADIFHAHNAIVDRITSAIMQTALRHQSVEQGLKDQIRALESRVVHQRGVIKKHAEKIESLRAEIGRCHCSYCGHITAREDCANLEQYRAAISNHILVCPKRPEAQLVDTLLVVARALEIELELFKPENRVALQIAIMNQLQELALARSA